VAQRCWEFDCGIRKQKAGFRYFVLRNWRNRTKLRSRKVGAEESGSWENGKTCSYAFHGFSFSQTPSQKSSSGIVTHEYLFRATRQAALAHKSELSAAYAYQFCIINWPRHLLADGQVRVAQRIEPRRNHRQASRR